MNIFKIVGISVIAVIAFTLVSCGCCKKGACTKTNEDGMYNVVMSFVSQASGPDRPSHMAFKTYIDKIEDKDKKISVETYTWWREGEKDYCINFLCIKSKEKKKIVADLKAIAATSDLTYLFENTSCKHKK